MKHAENSTLEDLIGQVTLRFVGFSLERRYEWNPKPWRVRIIPNKAERQDYKITVFAETATGALEAVIAEMEEVDNQRSTYV